MQVIKFKMFIQVSTDIAHTSFQLISQMCSDINLEI